MKILIIAVIILVSGGVGWSALSNQSEKNDAMMQKESAMVEKTNDVMEKKEESTVMMAKDIVVALGALNASGQTGTATLGDMNGKTKVVLTITSGAAGVPQPSHIHMGSCQAPGAIAYPLTAVVNGKAETILDVSLSMLGSKLPLLIMVHKSKEEAKTFVSCGNLPKEGFPVAMMEKKSEGAMMTNAGSYEVYSPEKIAKATTGKVVLFFRAGWCPTCKALDADIRSHLKDIPADVTILDVDYDNSTVLKQKYGVTYQHTLVQVDASGNQITKWSGGLTLADFITHIK